MSDNDDELKDVILVLYSCYSFIFLSADWDSGRAGFADGGIQRFA